MRLTKKVLLLAIISITSIFALDMTYDFTGEDGQGADHTGTNITTAPWTVDVTGCDIASGDYLEVNTSLDGDETLECLDIDGTGYWISEAIDVSGSTGNIYLSFEYAVSGSLEASDDITVYARFSTDGSTWDTGSNELFHVDGDTVAVDTRISTNLSSFGTGGTNYMQIVVAMASDVGTEYLYFDNLNIADTFTDPVPVLDVTGTPLIPVSESTYSDKALPTNILVMNFSESVVAAGAGTITLSSNNGSGWDTVETLTANVNGSSPGDVEISDSTVRLHLAAALNNSTKYRVTMGSDCFEDSAGGAFAGLSTTDWEFMTTDPYVELQCGFESGMPPYGWEENSIDHYTGSSPSASEGSYVAKLSADGDYLITPELKAADKLIFDVGQSSSGTSMIIEYSTTDTLDGSFSPISSSHIDGTTFAIGAEDWSWETRVVDLSSYTGLKYIRFKRDSGYMAYDKVIVSNVVPTYPDISVEVKTNGGLWQSVISGGTFTIAQTVKSTSAVTNTLSISNAGVADLNISSVSWQSSDAAYATNDGNLSAAIAAGSTTTNLQVIMTPPGTSGTVTATLRISSDDPDTADYDISFSCDIVDAPEPEIDIHVDGGSSNNNSTYNFGNVSVGSFETVPVVVSNAGTADLNISSVDLTGTGYSFSGLPGVSAGSVISPSFTGELVLKYEATDTSLNTGTLTIDSDDSDEASFVINLEAQGVNEANIALSYSNSTSGGYVEAASGASIDLGDILAGSAPLTNDILITNGGGVDLNISSISWQVSDAAFSTNSQKVTTPLTGGSFDENLDVILTPPASTGPLTATLRVTSDDSDTPDYDITFTCNIVAPELDVHIDGGSSNDGDTYNFGEVFTGSYKDVMICVSNAGGYALNISNVYLSGTGYSLESTIADDTAIAASGTNGIVLRYTPSDVSTNEGTLIISNDDADEAAFTLNLSAYGGVAPDAYAGFESGAADAGWLDNSIEYYTGGSSPSPYAGSYVAKLGADGDYLITPELDKSSNMTFQAAQSGDTIRRLKIEYSTNSTNEADFTGNSLEAYIDGGSFDMGAFDWSWEERTIELWKLLPNTNVKYIRFAREAGTVAFDEIKIYPGAPEPELALYITNAGKTMYLSASNEFDMGEVLKGANPITNYITISNVGDETLNISSISLLNSDSVFSVENTNISTIAAGAEDTTLMVILTPDGNEKTAGAVLRVSSDDPDRPDFDVYFTSELIGTPEPAIEVYVAGGASNSSDTYSLGSVNIGSSNSVSIVISNKSLTNLMLSNVTLAGTGYSVTPLIADDTELSAGDYTNLTIYYSATDTLTNSGSLTVNSDATNENSFILNLHAYGAPAPSIEQGFETDVPTGAEPETINGWEFNSIDPNTTTVRSGVNSAKISVDDDYIITPEIVNPSSISLYLIGDSGKTPGLKIEFSADKSSWTEVVATNGTADTWTEISADISGRGNGYIKITRTQSYGHYIDDVKIYTLNESEISVYDDGQAFVSGATNDFGTSQLNSDAQTNYFEIVNEGNVALDIGDITISGDSQFSLLTNGGFSIAAGATNTNVGVVFTPGSVAGDFSAVMVISNNDSDEGAYELNFTGTTADLLKPNISVLKSDGSALVHGGTLDLGSVYVDETKEFTISVSNGGTAELNVSSFSFNKSQFSVSGGSLSAGATIAVNSSKTIVAEYDPDTDSDITATLTINSDATNYSNFMLNISATAAGVSPKLIISELCDPDITDYKSNRYIEIYNAGTNDIDLGGWELRDYANGSEGSTATHVWTLSGTIASGEAKVAAAGDSYGINADFTIDWANTSWTGGLDDGAMLYKDGVLIDAVTNVSFENSATVRKSTIGKGTAVTDPTDWTVIAVTDISNDTSPGTHDSFYPVTSSITLENTDVSSADVNRGSSNVTLFAFSADDTNYTISKFVNISNMGAESIAGMYVYLDVNNDAAYDSGDTLLETMTYDSEGYWYMTNSGYPLQSNVDYIIVADISTNYADISYESSFCGYIEMAVFADSSVGLSATNSAAQRVLVRAPQINSASISAGSLVNDNSTTFTLSAFIEGLDGVSNVTAVFSNKPSYGSYTLTNGGGSNWAVVGTVAQSVPTGSYDMIVSATDAKGATNVSFLISGATVTGNNLPEITSLTLSTNMLLNTGSGSLTISAQVSDSDGTITNVIADLSSFGGLSAAVMTNNSGTYEYVFTPTAGMSPLSNAITVTPYDNSGGYVSSNVGLRIISHGAPSVNAGVNQTVDGASQVDLNPTITTSNSANYTVLWELISTVDTSGWSLTDDDNFNLFYETAEDTSFIAPDVQDTTTMTFRLTVTDEFGLTNSDTLTITVNTLYSEKLDNADVKEQVLMPGSEIVEFEGVSYGATVTIYTVRGRLVDEFDIAGSRRWRVPDSLAAGIYIVFIDDGVNEPKKMKISVIR